MSYKVTAWHDARVRALADTESSEVSIVTAGTSYTANCWTNGQHIDDAGHHSNIWIQLALSAGGVGYVSAIYLKGTDTAGLPDEAKCK